MKKNDPAHEGTSTTELSTAIDSNTRNNIGTTIHIGARAGIAG